MLEIHNLKVSIEDTEILKGIDLTIKPGEVHVVMGPNGGGKSTLAQTLMGHPNFVVSSPDSEVSMDKENILEKSPDERAKAGMFLAFQYPVSVSGVSVQNFMWRAWQALNPEKKMGILDFRKEMEKRAEELGVQKELLKRSLNEGFSGGEKKRIEILQLLILRPKYVILDEIDSGLDIDAIQMVADGVKRALKEFSPGVLVITHYKRILTYLSPDRVHVLVGGKIVESGGNSLVEKLEADGYKKYLKE